MRDMTINPSESAANSSPARGAAADIRPVLSDLSRRRLLQAGSVFGLLSLVGCAGDNVASSEPLPAVP
ncbi:MAG TPA: hypothetical protein VFF65_01885, partial [Phycisphaerales bacterium]|nr:hypothetical protein [Phycisphaerales bacterium]